MQLKAGETGGRAPSLGTSAAREQEPSVWHMQPGPSSFTCETPTPASVPRQNKSPHHDPRVDHPQLGFVSWCIVPAIVLHVWSAVAFWESCKWV